jgi:hypothetical protein
MLRGDCDDTIASGMWASRQAEHDHTIDSLPTPMLSPTPEYVEKHVVDRQGPDIGLRG